MNLLEARESPNPRTRRILSLPCGHHVDVELDASLIGLSGPVLSHQSNCRGERTTRFAAWFVPGVVTRPEAAPLTGPPRGSGQSTVA